MPFATIAIAEIGDKTQLAMMAMAARYKHTLQIFIGAMAASAIVDGSAVVLGNYASRYVPKTPVTIAAGVLFILFGVYTLLKKEEKESEKGNGKKSMLAAAFLLGTQYNLPLALSGALTGIAAVLIVMLHIGKFVSRHLNEKVIRLLSALLFISIGLLTLLRLLGNA